MEKTILEMEHITKYIYDVYGKPVRGSNVKILDDVHLDVKEQEVHILIGENGAGKSTLMKILGGIIPCEGGSIKLFDQTVHFTNPRQSQEMGIGFIHQELDLCRNLDVGGKPVSRQGNGQGILQPEGNVQGQPRYDGEARV